MAAILGYNNVYYQNLELPLMVVNVFLVEIALPIAKWELTFVVMLKRRKHCSFLLWVVVSVRLFVLEEY
jgi:hypothetical protein